MTKEEIISGLKKIYEDWKKEPGKTNFLDIDGLIYLRLQPFLSSAITATEHRVRGEVRGRINNLLSQKYEGIERINAKLEEMIMYCLSDEYDDSPKSSDSLSVDTDNQTKI